MRLLRLREVERTPNDRVFRYSRLHAIAITLAMIGAVAWLLFQAYSTGWKPGYYFAAGMLLFLLPTRRFITARFLPSNWLVRANDTGFFVQFRSYLNYHLPADDLTVVYLDYGEISSARLVKERLTTPNSTQRGSQRQTQYLRYVEVELACDAAALTKALQDELSEPEGIWKNLIFSHWRRWQSCCTARRPISATWWPEGYAGAGPFPRYGLAGGSWCGGGRCWNGWREAKMLI